MKSAAQYLAEAKARLGDSRMSDETLGEHFRARGLKGGFSQQEIQRAKAVFMTDPIAIAIATVLEIEPGEVIWVARAERERDPVVRSHLARWSSQVGKALASAPAKAASVFVATLAVVLMSFLPARDAQAVGGAGRF